MLCPAARAHPADEQQITLLLEIERSQVQQVVLMPAWVFLREVFGQQSMDVYRALSEGEVKQRVGQYMAEHHPVSIDGIQVQPVVGNVEIFVSQFLYSQATGDQRILEAGAAEIELRYEAKTRPNQVSFIWRLYLPKVATPYDPEPLPDGQVEMEQVWAQLGVDGKGKLIAFSPGEPQFVWHSDDAAAPPPSLLAPAQAPPMTLEIPVASLLLLAAGGVGAWLVKSVRGRVGLIVAAGAVAGGLLGTGGLEVELPWKKRLPMPDPHRALAIFETLHRNIYRAFDYTSEHMIYETLARSVAGAQLERIYSDVYESLVLREEGGAVCKVQSVEIQEAQVVEPTAKNKGGSAPPEPAKPAQETDAFHVRCRWQVHGAVHHWGHVHTRLNEYEAIYTLAPRGGQWKIVNTQVLEQKRVAEAPSPSQ